MAFFKTSFFGLIKYDNDYSFLNNKFECEELKVMYQYSKLRIDGKGKMNYIVSKITCFQILLIIQQNCGKVKQFL